MNVTRNKIKIMHFCNSRWIYTEVNPKYLPNNCSKKDLLYLLEDNRLEKWGPYFRYIAFVFPIPQAWPFIINSNLCNNGDVLKDFRCQLAYFVFPFSYNKKKCRYIRKGLKIRRQRWSASSSVLYTYFKISVIGYKVATYIRMFLFISHCPRNHSSDNFEQIFYFINKIYIINYYFYMYLHNSIKLYV